ncbi:hypothetical protein BT96DRAFT_1004322 [Gymnopus androsaceus JB14]|uniref:Uncharacterized protein n=1 Tax=Gymnopus androsaceus JB14 TaxID=1447944 RepID=A0A6A4GT10_9AGAR|nr:hypothetical protein BT96DRAFT_1004322 [Gymnopus androsaceus JB14]
MCVRGLFPFTRAKSEQLKVTPDPINENPDPNLPEQAPTPLPANPAPLEPTAPVPAPTRDNLLIQEPHRSIRICKPTTRLIESEASEDREREAKETGHAWANDLPPDQQPLALIVQNPWAFASTDSEFWVPQSYKQAI